MRRKYVGATEELKENLKRRKEALVVEDLQKLRCKADGTVEVHKWMTEVPGGAPKCLARACKDRWEDEDLPQWTHTCLP